MIAPFVTLGHGFTFHLSYDGHTVLCWNGARHRSDDRESTKLRVQNCAPHSPKTFNRGVWPHGIPGVNTLSLDGPCYEGAPPPEAMEQYAAMQRQSYLEHLAWANKLGVSADPMPPVMTAIWFDMARGMYMTVDGRPAHIEAEGFRDPRLPHVHWAFCPGCGETFVRRRPEQDHCWDCKPEQWPAERREDYFVNTHGVALAATPTEMSR